MSAAILQTLIKGRPKTTKPIRVQVLLMAPGPDDLSQNRAISSVFSYGLQHQARV
jgi:hypothetical protein